MTTRSLNEADREAVRAFYAKHVDAKGVPQRRRLGHPVCLFCPTRLDHPNARMCTDHKKLAATVRQDRNRDGGPGTRLVSSRSIDRVHARASDLAGQAAQLGSYAEDLHTSQTEIREYLDDLRVAIGDLLRACRKL